MRPAPIVTTLLSLVPLACLLQAQEPPPTAPQGANASFAEGEDVDTPAAGLKGARYVQIYGMYLEPENADVDFRGDASLDSGAELGFSGGWGAGFTFGYDFGAAAEGRGRDVPISLDPRIELDCSYRTFNNTTPYSTGDGGLAVREDPYALTVGVNAIAELNIKGPVDPYAGAGIGLSYVEVNRRVDDAPDSDFERATDTVPSFQLLAGVGYEIDYNITIYGGARYFRTDTLDLDGAVFELESLEWEVGVRMSF